MAGGYQVVPAPNFPGNSSGGDEMKQYGQMSKMGQPDFYQKEDYKDRQDVDEMLPGQKMYYLQSQNAISSREGALRNKMMQYFSTSQNIPTSGMQREWNTEMSNIEQQKMVLKSSADRYKQNFKNANARTDELIKGGEKSTANRLAMRYVNGVPVPILGPKEAGGQGWLTQLEEVKGFDYAPGATQGGAPVDTDLQTSINYTGDFNKFVDDRFKEVSKSKTVTPQVSGIDKNGQPIYSPQSATPLFGTKDVQYMSVMTNSSNLEEVQRAAGNMIELMPEPAKLDLAGKFYEKLLYAQSNSDGTIGFRMDNEIGDMHFNKAESGTIMKMLNMQKMGREDTSRIDDMINKYGKNLILSQVRPHVESQTTLRDIKVKGEGAEGSGSIRGGFTQIATGQAEPSGKAMIAFKQGNSVISNSPGVILGKTGSPELQLNRWTVPVRDVSDFNKNAKDALINQGGILPSHFSQGQNFFYSQDGIPNDAALLDGGGARIIGLTGDVQENFIPVSQQAKKGYELDMPDIANMPVSELKQRVIKTVGVQLAVPDNSDFFDNIRVASGIDVERGVSKSNFEQREYYDEYSGGKKAGKKPYRIVTVWMPITKDSDLFQFEGNNYYAKGTYQAQQDMIQESNQRKQNVLNQVGSYSTIN